MIHRMPVKPPALFQVPQLSTSANVIFRTAPHFAAERRGC